jgi:CRP-like cAMP-binding protein
MMRLCANCPQLSFNVGRILLARIRQLEERVTEIATENVEQRVASLLIRLEQVIGRRTHEGVELVLNRKELAQMIGASLFSVSRLLAEWSDSGIVVARRRAIIIPDLFRVKLAAA